MAGYRLEIRDPELFEDFTERSRLTLDTKDIPTQTRVSGLIGASEDHTLDDLRAKRDQEVAYALAHRIMAWFDDGRDSRPWYFPQVLRITKRWMAECVTYHGGTFPGLLLLAENADEAARRILHESISWQEGNKFAEVVPLFRQGDRTGSTDDVDFFTTKEVYPTGTKCHVNFVVLDGPAATRGSGPWRRSSRRCPGGRVCEKRSSRFHDPVHDQRRSHEYFPDFLARLKARDDEGPVRTLIVEVSGKRKNRTAPRRRPHREGPVGARVNAHSGFGLWGYAS